MNAAEIERAREIKAAYERGMADERRVRDWCADTAERAGYEDGHRAARRVGRVLILGAFCAGVLLDKFPW